MIKILFVAINARYAHTNPALLYLQKITGERADTAIAEFTISQDPYDILATLTEYRPDVISFSVYIWNSGLVKALLEDLKKVLPEVQVVLGGPDVSYNPDQWLSRYDAIDYIISGGGEEGWQNLLGHQFQYPERVLRVPNRVLNEVPFPYDAENIHLLKNRIIYYESSRGCPYSCSYCLSSRQDTRLELRDPEKVEEELLFFINNKVPLVKFVDRTFNAVGEHSRRIWSFIRDQGSETRFHFEINPLLLSGQDLDLLQDIPQGLFQFEIGVQSTNTETLREVCRQGDWSEIRDKIETLIRETSIPVHLDLIFGLPYETFQLAQRSFNDLYQLQSAHLQPGMLKVLPGTVMADKVSQYDLQYQEEAPYKILSNKWLSFRELNILQRLEHLVNNLYNSHRFSRTLENLVDLNGSPFELFRRLDYFWSEREINPWQKDWLKTATLIAEFVRQEYKVHYNFILDCLRWDLCSGSGLQFYPDFLLTPELAELLNNWRKVIRMNADKLMTELATNKRYLQRGMIFRPCSKLYREKYQSGKDQTILFLLGAAKEMREICIENTWEIINNG